MARALRQQSPQSPLDREGFLCPMCLQDLGSAASLANHFDNAHNSTESTDVIDQVKGFFGKAKKFFALEDEANTDVTTFRAEPVTTVEAASSIEFFEPQCLGKTRNLTDGFKAMRDSKVDQTVIECNKLVIRLSKLSADDLPEDNSKRKAFEQSVVRWAEDGSVKVCSTCGKGFNIARRRHHCRLCGGIMCDKCSEFLPLSQAKRLTTTVTSSELTVSQPVFLKRSGSNSSLSSLGSKEEGLALRLCANCRKLLELHRSKQEQRHFVPPIAELYQKLQGFRSESEKLTPQYIKMAFSLGSGETTYSLDQASTSRQQIARLYNNIESISKKIINLQGEEGEVVSQTAVKLRLHIRAYAISYIQDCSATLPPLPDEKKFAQLVREREEERKRRVQIQLQDSQERARQQQQLPIKKKAVPAVSHSDSSRLGQQKAAPSGWLPGDVDSQQVMDDDPLVQQMNIIRGYLKQAKQAEKYDEVEMLEENLRQLKIQFQQQ